MNARPRPTRALPGVVSHDGRQMVYDHGQNAAYALDRCRCEPCRRSNREAARDRARQIAPAYVDAAPARAHVRFLQANGLGLKTIAARSGVSHGALTKLIYGVNGRTPSKRITPRNLERLLAVSPADAADCDYVDAAPTWQRINAMVDAGVPRARIAEALGTVVPALQVSRTRVHARTARTIKQLHTDWIEGRVTLQRHDRYGNATVIAPPPRVPDYIDRSKILIDLCEVLERRNEEPWRVDAACRNRPPSIWFPTTKDDRLEAAAKRICRACLVRSQCLSANLAEPDGIYGGLNPAERRERRRIEVGAA